MRPSLRILRRSLAPALTPEGAATFVGASLGIFGTGAGVPLLYKAVLFVALVALFSHLHEKDPA